MTDAQETALATLNDKWGVARWTVQPDGDVTVELDDGDDGVIEPDGSNTWGV
jgi:hypothetical protein